MTEVNVVAEAEALERQEDSAPSRERQPPLGRNVVVNLVYDEGRRAVVAIYGTARDFRTFVAAFRIGLGLEPSKGAQTS